MKNQEKKTKKMLTKQQKNEFMKEITYRERSKSTFVAVLLGIVIPGGGQFYTGNVGKGFAFLIVTGLAWIFLLGWLVHFAAFIEGCVGVDSYNKNLKNKLEIEYS
jgi:TM2 domain-containing membrane protein YozV